MKILFMGTPDFAAEILKKLAEYHNVTAVISQPDKPKGRGNKLQPTPVKEFALSRNIPVYQPESIKDPEFQKTLKKIEADIYVVAAYGQIIPESVLKIPPLGSINIHASLLPEYRGAAPIQRALMDGRDVTGVTIMYMEKKLDCGDMILKKEVKIEPSDNFGTLHDKLAQEGSKLIIEALKLFEKGKVKAEKQDERLSSYASMIKKETRIIDWSKSSDEIINLIRALNPVPAAFTNYKNDVFKIYEAEKAAKAYEGKCGEIMDIIPQKGFIVKTGSGALLIKVMQSKGGRKMNCSDYMRGHKIEKGIILN